jgi:hypothetical protein
MPRRGNGALVKNIGMLFFPRNVAKCYTNELNRQCWYTYQKRLDVTSRGMICTGAVPFGTSIGELVDSCERGDNDQANISQVYLPN